MQIHLLGLEARSFTICIYIKLTIDLCWDVFIVYG